MLALMFNLLSWNVRGINDRDRRLLLKNILRDRSCDLVCIQEAELEDVKLSDIHSIVGNQSIDFVAFKAQGPPGGIIVMGDKNSSNLVYSSCGYFSISYLLQIVGGDFNWAFGGGCLWSTYRN